jgi:hypothetical protein
VRGIAHARDYSVLQQRMLSKALDASQKARTVDAVLNRVLTNANAQAKVLETKLSPDLMQAHDEFLRATFDLEPPIFYSPSTNGELQSVYSEVKAALNKPEKPLKKGEQLDPPMPDIFHADPRQLQSWLEQVSRLDSTAAMQFVVLFHCSVVIQGCPPEDTAVVQLRHRNPTISAPLQCRMDDVLRHARMPLSRFCLLQHAFIRMILDVAGAIDQLAVQSRQPVPAEGSTASDAADGADVEGVTAAIKCACMQSVDPLSSLHDQSGQHASQ